MIEMYILIGDVAARRSIHSNLSDPFSHSSTITPTIIIAFSIIHISNRSQNYVLSETWQTRYTKTADRRMGDGEETDCSGH